MANTSYTWNDIKLATLQKMFAASGSNIPTDESTVDYLAAMPYAANEALQMIASAGKFIINSINIALVPSENLLGDTIGRKIYQTIKSMDFSAESAQSYYFEYAGTGTCKIYVGDTLIQTITLAENNGYKAVKGVVTNTASASVKLSFETQYTVSVKNIAFYEGTFASADKVPDYSDYIRYSMNELVTDFYMLDDTPVTYEGSDTTGRYLNVNEYHVEGGDILLLPRSMPGNYIVYYKAFPTAITISTADDYVMPVTPEVATLLPLYMASQLYKDDDNGVATAYRNEFEVAFNRLKNPNEGANAERFTSESGWI